MKKSALTVSSVALAALLLMPNQSPRAAGLDDTIYTFFQVEQLEHRMTDGTDVSAWDVNAWVGNDDHRLAFKSEGEKPAGTKLEAAELQFLYRRPVSEFFDINIGIRHDLRPDPDRTYGVIGFQGLAKQYVEMDADLFISETGDVSLRFEAEKDFLLTQKLVLQPLLEMNIAFSEDTEIASGAGVNDLELGLRLRYEIKRKFAPYVGLHW